MATKMDKREVARFLDKLYQPGEVFEVAYIRPGGDRVARVNRTYGEAQVEGLLGEMERAEAAGFNVYASPLTVRSQATQSFDRIWVDQDDPEAPWPFGSDEAWASPAWPMPTTLVKTSDAETGFRWQAIWLLRERLDASEARPLMKRLAAKAGADGSVHDARRVLRVPGIFNAKRGTATRLIDTTDGRVSVETFGVEEDSTSLLDQLLATEVINPAAVLGEWLRGTDEGDRSRKAYVCARFLKSCGVSWLDAGAIMKVGATRSQPPMEDRELEHALNSAYNRKD